MQAELASNKLQIETNSELIEEERQNLTETFTITDSLSSTVNRLDKVDLFKEGRISFKPRPSTFFRSTSVREYNDIYISFNQ